MPLVNLPPEATSRSSSFSALMALAGLGGGNLRRVIDPGIYVGHLNAYHDIEVYLDGLRFDDLEIEGIEDYGICDSPKQFAEDCGSLIDADPRPLVVVMTCIAKADEPEREGWRWHKWGPYIGRGEPTTEYLYDEPEFDEVYVYHIYLVKPEVAVYRESV